MPSWPSVFCWRCAAVITTGFVLFTLSERKYAVSSEVFEPCVTTTPATCGSFARMRFTAAEMSIQFCTEIADEPTRIRSTTSIRAWFAISGICASTVSTAMRPVGEFAIVPPVATIFTSGFCGAGAARAKDGASSANVSADAPISA